MSKFWLDTIQGVLTTVDTSATVAGREEGKRWFQEDSAWREEDLEWREHAYASGVSGVEHHDGIQRWRDADIDQRNLENARTLWLRFVEKNRRDVEEKTTNLKAVSNIAAIFAGFAVVSLTQLHFDESQTPMGLITAYGMLTGITTGLMCITLVSSTLLLGSIVKNGKMYVNEVAEEDFMQACRLFCETYQPGDRPPQPRRTFESFWATRCERRWQLAQFCFQWGVSAFLVGLIPTGWIVFLDTEATVISWLVTVGAALCLWFYVQFYWSSYLRASPSSDFNGEASGRAAGLPYDWHLSPGLGSCHM